MHKKPFALPIKTPLGYRFCETARNEIARAGRESLEYIRSILN